MRFGLLMPENGPPVSFDPSSLLLSGWWKASFTASPWIDQINGGSSNLAEATNPPTVGTAVNSFTPAVFDGTDDKLATTAGLSTFYTGSAYAMCALIKVVSFTVGDSGATAPYASTLILGNTNAGDGYPLGGVVGSGASGVFRFGHHNGSAWNSAASAISSGVWAMVAAWYDGVNIKTSVNVGTSASVAQAVNAGSATGTLGIGPDLLSEFPNIQMLEGMTRKTPWTSTELSNIKSYFNSTYVLSL